MQRSPRPGKTSSTLSDPFQRRLNAYALAAAATGVGALALAQPAEGKIVYTPAHRNCETGFIQIDLNHDGFVDFVVACNSNPFGTTGAGTLDVQVLAGSSGSGSNRIAGYDVTVFQTFFSTFRAMGFAWALPAGARVSTAKNEWGLLALKSCFRSCKSFGQWLKNGKGVKDHYLGLKFVIKGKWHYGWARVSVSTYERLDAALTGYAYETIPNKPIIAGKTKGPDVYTVQDATLGHLAAGAVAITRR
jgi:hypothetical protein